MLNPTRRMQHLFYWFEDYKEKTPSPQLGNLHHQDNSCVMDLNYFAKLYSLRWYVHRTNSCHISSEVEIWNLPKVAEHSFVGGQR